MLLPDLYRYHVQAAMADTASRHDEIGKVFNTLDRAAQDNYLKAVVMIHMHMHTG